MKSWISVVEAFCGVTLISKGRSTQLPRICFVNLKRMRGYDLYSSGDFNKAFMMKCGWGLCNRREDLWVKIVKI